MFAYTIKGWMLPTEGHPANHSALLNPEQYAQLAQTLGTDPQEPWAPFDDESPEAALCAATARRLERPEPKFVADPPAVPDDLGREHKGEASTQQAFGRFFVDLVREAPGVADRVVTVSPDVGTSTNLGGWINKAGIWAPGDRIDWFADDTDTLVRWRESDHGRHMELGIAEVNLVGLLGELGATWSRDGQPLLPVGTIYDPFVSRALEPWSFGIYAGGQSILVGTPSGVTLGPEGGAHQSVITPSIGIEQPGCVAWEPAFGQDLEWTLLHALGELGREGGSSAYFRLSTRPIDQSLHTGTREEVLAGGYRLRAPADPRVSIVVMGALVPEAIAAADVLEAEAGVAVEVICVTSADLLFRSFQARAGLGEGDPATIDRLFGAPRPDRHAGRRPPAHARVPGRRGRARRSRAWACRTSASRATSPSSTSTTRSTRSRWSAPRSTCSTRDGAVPDVAVVGGGIVGLATARELALRGRRVLVLEREPALGAHQTSHNSGVIHQGIYYAPGSLKARLCREGADALYEYCAAQRDRRREACGKVVVAVRDADLPRLDELERRAARERRARACAALGPAELREIEPEATGLAALHSPQTGIVDFAAVAAAYARDVEAHGGEIRTGAEVRAVRRPARTAWRSCSRTGRGCARRAR